VRHLVEHWWLWVAVTRWPALAARLRECEQVVARSGDRATRRGVSGDRRDPPDGGPGRVSDWTWEYVPDSAHVVGGLSPGQCAEVEALARRIADAVTVRMIGQAFQPRGGRLRP
jgi:hypothetical protein